MITGSDKFRNRKSTHDFQRLLISFTHIPIVFLLANNLHVCYINATEHHIVGKICKIGTQTMHRVEYEMQTLSKSDRNKYHQFQKKNWSTTNYMQCIYGIPFMPFSFGIVFQNSHAVRTNDSRFCQPNQHDYSFIFRSSKIYAHFYL